jgi:hypothetical protein
VEVTCPYLPVVPPCNARVGGCQSCRAATGIQVRQLTMLRNIQISIRRSAVWQTVIFHDQVTCNSHQNK